MLCRETLYSIPEIFKLNLDDLSEEEKPWLKDKDKISEYFNYGFNEDTWKRYRTMVLARSDEVQKMKEEAATKKKANNKNLFHHVLNFNLPHEFGGFGDPLELKYS